MSVMWAAMSPESGLFHPVERRSAVKDRQNASTTCVPMAREFPVLILAFRDNHAVVHLLRTTE
ncbi:hypothetical protein [Streptomyces sp. NPDC004230]